MRKLMLPVTLVGAAFAGGSLANGPGLRWAADRLREVGTKYGSSIEQLDPGPPTAGSELATLRPTTPAPLVAPSKPEATPPGGAAPGAAPASQVPPLVVVKGASTPAASPETPPPIVVAPRSPSVSTTPEPPASAAAAPAAAPAPAESTAPTPPPRTGAIELIKSIGAKVAAGATPPASSPATAAPTEASPSSTAIRDEQLARAAGTPSPAPVPEPPAAAPASQPPPITADAAVPPAPTLTWADIQRRLSEVGVTRYWIEAEPGTAARFRCLIPLTEGRSVGHSFEAEGADPLQAAEAALRRIALWQAAEHASTAP